MTVDRTGRPKRLLAVSIILTATIMTVTLVPSHASTLVFGSIVNLSSDASSSGSVRTAASGNNVYVAWLNNTSGNSNVLLRESSNNGSSFGAVVRITNSTNQNSANQQIAAIGSDVYLVWQANTTFNTNHIFFRASTNNGASFGPLIDLSSGVTCGGGCTLSTSTVPNIAVVGNNVYIVWLGGTTKGMDIFFRASTNNGSAFATALSPLTTNAYGSTQPQIAAITTFVYVTWSDLGSVGRAQTFFAASSNSGTSFAYVAAHSLTSTLSGETDLYQAIAATGSSVYVTWTNDTINSDNTMFIASTSNGAGFGSVQNLNKAIVFDLNPQLAASGNNVYIVWSDTSGSGTEVVYRLSISNGAGFGSIVNLSNTPSASNGQKIAASGNNVYVAWVETAIAGTDIYFVSSSDSGSTFGSPLNLSQDSGSVAPAVASAGSQAYVSWEDDKVGNGDAFFVVGAPPSFDFSITNSGTISVQQGASGSNKITLTLLSGTSQSVTLSCSSGLPAGASCSFNPVSGLPNFVSNLTITAAMSTPTGSYTITVTGTAGTLSHTTQFTLTVNPAGSVGGTVVGVAKFYLLAQTLGTLLMVTGPTIVAAFLYYRRKQRLQG